MSHSRFQQDLLYGKRAEQKIIDLLLLQGFVKAHDDFARHDFQLLLNDQTHRVEIKNEDAQRHTGNLCIEVLQGFGSRQRPSGIASSEATVFVHTLCDNCALYRRRDMHLYTRELCRSGKKPQLFRGSDNNNHGYIIPIVDLLGFDWFDLCSTNSIAKSRLWSF